MKGHHKVGKGVGQKVFLDISSAKEAILSSNDLITNAKVHD